MVSSVEFYLCEEPSINECFRRALQITEKFYLDQKKVFIYVNTFETASQLNDLLWTFHDTSFLPHEIYKEASAPSTTIAIGYLSTAPHNWDILINLSDTVPPFYSKFKRISEFVPSGEIFKTRARERYKFYKEQGFNLQTIKTSQTP